MATALLLPAAWINVIDLEEAEAELQRAGLKTTQDLDKDDDFAVWDDFRQDWMYVSQGDQLVILPSPNPNEPVRIVAYSSIPHRWIAF